MAENASCVQGLGDRALSTVDPSMLTPKTPSEVERVERLRSTRQELGEVIVARLARLPATFRMALEDGGELMMVHGSPADPTVAMTHDMSDEELLALLGDDPADVVVCGASHVPFVRMVGPTRIINVGSVGEAPTALVAHATIVATSPAGVDVHPLAVALGPPSGD